VYADGRVTIHALPKGDWMAGSVFGMPVLGAVLIISHAIPNDGAYLVIGSAIEKIVHGYIRAFAVSPDGCKVAMDVVAADGLVAHIATLNVCKVGR
jgi:hypothetical protein